MKKLALLMVFVLCFTALVGCGGNADNNAKEGDKTAEAGKYTDGTYTGSAEGFGGDVEVEVVVEGGNIKTVTVTNHSESVDKVAEVQQAIDELPTKIVEANGTEGVDGISGATYTSTAILEATNTALAAK